MLRRYRINTQEWPYPYRTIWKNIPKIELIITESDYYLVWQKAWEADIITVKVEKSKLHNSERLYTTLHIEFIRESLDLLDYAKKMNIEEIWKINVKQLLTHKDPITRELAKILCHKDMHRN